MRLTLWSENGKERDQSVDGDADANIELTGSVKLNVVGPVTDCCEHDSETSVSMKGGTFLDHLSDSDSREALYCMRMVVRS